MRPAFLLAALALTLPAAAAPVDPPQASAAAAAARPEAADVLLKRAQAEAKKHRRAVFVRFTASWCGWCRLMEKTLDEPEVRKIFERHYVVVTLDVLEQGAKKALENPGGEAVLEALGGKGGGIPFWAALDASGKKLMDANLMPGNQNVGCPATPEEIVAFGEFLKKTAPRLGDAERQVILDRFTANAPKR